MSKSLTFAKFVIVYGLLITGVANAEQTYCTGELVVNKVKDPEKCFDKELVGKKYPVKILIDNSGTSIKGWLEAGSRIMKIEGKYLSELSLFQPNFNKKASEGSVLALITEKQNMRGTIKENGDNSCAWTESQFVVTPTESASTIGSFFERRYKAELLKNEAWSYLNTSTDLAKAHQVMEQSFKITLDVWGWDNPITVKALDQLAFLLWKYKGLDSAIAMLENHLKDVSATNQAKLKESIASFWAEKGVVLTQNSNNAEALECYRTASVLAPLNANYQRSLVNIYLSLGKPKEARISLEQAEKLATVSTEGSWAELGQLASRIGDYDTALRYFKQAINKVTSDRVISEGTLKAIVNTLEQKYNAATLATRRSLFASLLKDTNPVVIYGAAYALGMVGTENSAKELLEPLAAGDRFLKTIILGSIRKIGSQKTAIVARDCLKNNDPHVQTAALELVIRYRTKEAMPEVLHLIKAPNSYVADLATKALSVIADKRNISELLLALPDDNKDLAGDIFKALRRIGDPSAVDTVIKYAAAHIDDSTKSGKNYGLIESVARNLDDEKAMSRLQKHDSLLKRVLSSEFSYESIFANQPHEIFYLAEQGTSQKFYAILKDKSRTEAEHAVALLAIGKLNALDSPELIINAAKSDNSFVRRSALIAICNMKLLQGTNALLSAVKNYEKSDKRIFDIAVSTLIELHDLNKLYALGLKDEQLGEKGVLLDPADLNKFALSTLKNGLSDKDNTENTLVTLLALPFGKLDLEATKILKEWLEDKSISTEHRAIACLALANAGDPSALTKLADIMINDLSKDDSVFILAVHVFGYYRQLATIYKYYSEGNSLQVFNTIRKTPYLTNDVAILKNSSKTFVQSIGHYLDALHASSVSDLNRQLGESDLAIKGFDSIESTPYLMLAYWLKAQALISLNKPFEALTTISDAEAILPNIVRHDHEDHGELFEEYNRYLKALAFLATGKKTEAVQTLKQTLTDLAYYKMEPGLYDSTIGLEKQIAKTLVTAQ